MGGLNQDPAIEKFNILRERMAEHARWSPRMIRYGLVFGLAIPYASYWVACRYDNVFDVQGKGHGMSLYKFPSLVYRDRILADQTKSQESEE